jgi:mannosyltransferase
VRSEPVIFHAHRNNELLLGLQLKRVAKQLKIVFTRHSAKAPGAYSRWLMKQCDRVLTLDAFPHGVDLARFSPPPDRAAAWAQLGQGGLYGIGVVGRIRPQKGQADFAAAVKPVPPDWRAVLVGLAKKRDRAFLDGLGVTHVGETLDVASWYRGLTIVVQPSHSESFGLVLLEAMASGCCVVAAGLPHYRQLIEPGRTGLFYPVGDAAGLRATLAPLLAEPARALAIGEAAAAVARDRFGIEREAARLREAYDAL